MVGAFSLILASRISAGADVACPPSPFAATCSLAVTTRDGTPVSVTKGEYGIGEKGNKRDIILWADHRASKEANEINASGSDVLKYVGGTMSLEMWVILHATWTYAGRTS